MQVTNRFYSVQTSLGIVVGHSELCNIVRKYCTVSCELSDVFLVQIYQTGTEQFNLKPLKGITYLQEHELLSTPLDPKEVVKFIKENPKLDKKQIGEFVSNKKYSTVLEEYQKYVIL